ANAAGLATRAATATAIAVFFRLTFMIALSLWYHGWNGCHRPRKSSASWLLVAFPEPATWLSCRTPLNPCSAVASTATEREALADAPGSMEVCSPADAETNDRPSSPVSRMPCEASAAVKIGRAHV